MAETIESHFDQTEPGNDRRLAAYKDRIADMGDEERAKHDEFVRRGYEVHGADFTEILLGYDSPRYEDDPETHLRTESGYEDAALPEQEAASIASKAEDLVERTLSDEVIHRDVVETPAGLMEIEAADLGGGVEMQAMFDDNGIEALAIEIDDGDEHHTIGVVHPETHPKIRLDGQPADVREVPIVKAVIEDIKVRRAAEKQGETDESQQGKKLEAADPAAKARARFAKDFIGAYLSNPLTRNFVAQRGVDLRSLHTRLSKGEVTISEAQIADMKRLSAEAHFRGSNIWNTQPGNQSMLQRAANEKRDQLLGIIKEL